MRDAARPLGSVPWRVAMAWRYQRAAVRTCPRAAATAADIKLVITFRSRGVLAALAVVPRGLFGLVQQAGLEQPPQATEHDDGPPGAARSRTTRCGRRSAARSPQFPPDARVLRTPLRDPTQSLTTHPQARARFAPMSLPLTTGVVRRFPPSDHLPARGLCRCYARGRPSWWVRFSWWGRVRSA